MMISTRNINGYKSRKNRLDEYLDKISPDVLCLQETRLKGYGRSQPLSVPGYTFIGSNCENSYSKHYGVAIVSRLPLIDFSLLDRKWLGLGMIYEFDKFYVFNIHIPTSRNKKGTALNRDNLVDNHLIPLINVLTKEKDLILCGDFNTASYFQEKIKTSGAGHSENEYEALERIKSVGLVDAYCCLHPSDDSRRLFILENKPPFNHYMDGFLVSRGIAKGLKSMQLHTSYSRKQGLR